MHPICWIEVGDKSTCDYRIEYRINEYILLCLWYNGYNGYMPEINGHLVINKSYRIEELEEAKEFLYSTARNIAKEILYKVGEE